MKHGSNLMTGMLVAACHANAAELSGTIRDNSTHLPVSGAEVSWSDGDHATRTGSDGKFMIVTPSGSKAPQLVVRADRYWSKRVPVDLNETRPIDIHLQAAKQRLIVTSDIGGTDPDDEQSMVHLLVCANEVDLEGIVPGLAWLDDKIGVDTTSKVIDAYAQALPNLRAHADGYPSAEALRAMLKPGQPTPRMAGVGEGKDSPGSELIIAVVDKDDPRPVWINVWGGANTIAQALWKVKNTRSPQDVAAFVAKMRVFDILGQDDAGAWMTKTFPDLFYVRSQSIYGWAPPDEWVKANVQSKGPLGAHYPDRRWATEGDSPAFMHVLANGLNDPNRIDQGGWGGRFGLEKKPGLRSMDIAVRSGVDESPYDPYLMFTNTGEGMKAITRWKADIYNDLQARMEWCVRPEKTAANHHPVAAINGDVTKQSIEVSAEAGSHLSLDASASHDPDGNGLAFKWLIYSEPSTYTKPVTVNDSDSAIATLLVPADASGKTIHIVLSLRDDGEPNLTSYRRVIVSVR